MSEAVLRNWLSALVVAAGVIMVMTGTVAHAQACTGITRKFAIAPGGGGFQGPVVWSPTFESADRTAECYSFANSVGMQVAKHIRPPPTYKDHSFSVYTYGGDGCGISACGTLDVPGGGPACSQIIPTMAETNNQCPPPADECDAEFPGVGDEFTTTVAPSSGGGSYCHALSNCKMEVSGSMGMGGNTVYRVKHTNEKCGDGQEESDEDDFEGGESCTTSSAGNELCMSKDGENCGYLNGNFVCLPPIDDDGCDVLGDGTRLCGSGAPSPPAPDDGETPGRPAPPDDVIQDQDGNTYNFYNNETINNSVRPPNASGDNPYDGDDDGDSTGSGVSSGGPGGEGTDDDGCTEEDDCTGTLPSLEDGAVCESFGACLSSFYSRLAAAPIVQSVSNVGSSMPSGSCPSVNISMFGESNSISSPMCDIWSGTISPIIGVMFLLIFAWVSARIVLSA